LDPYPCRTELHGCAFRWIRRAVSEAIRAGIPRDRIVPVYQTFGGGTWTDDGGASYALPSAAQETELLAMWKSVVPAPFFDYAYSWGSQHKDRALGQTPTLQAVLRKHNSGLTS
jgi:hypothetical protein